MTTLWQNVRYGFRMLARSPGFALVVILILGLGLGATTSVFSNSVMEGSFFSKSCFVSGAFV